MSISEILSFSLLAFTSVFFIVNPLGAAPVFLALTDGWSRADRVRAAGRSALIAGTILVVFALTGNLIFRLFGVTLGAFRVAGGSCSCGWRWTCCTASPPRPSPPPRTSGTRRRRRTSR